jgi:hypothetical protein
VDEIVQFCVGRHVDRLAERRKLRIGAVVGLFPHHVADYPGRPIAGASGRHGRYAK